MIDVQFRRYNLNMFYALEAILMTTSISAAASRACVSQPAMSLSLKKLRQDFNDQLVIHMHGQTHFTALADLLRPRVRAILREATDTFTLEAKFDPRYDQRNITLAMPGALEVLVAPSLIRKIDAISKNINITIRSDRQTTWQEQNTQRVDLYVTGEYCQEHELPSFPLMTEDLCCLVWNRNDLVGNTLEQTQYLQAGHAVCMEDEPIQYALKKHFNFLPNKVVRATTCNHATLPELIIGTNMVVTTFSRHAKYLATFMPLRAVSAPFLPSIPIVMQCALYRKDEPLLLWLRSILEEVAIGTKLGV